MKGLKPLVLGTFKKYIISFSLDSDRSMRFD